MHSYHFHIGDYASHTGHLTDVEDLAYRRLLDCYYLREGPLPSDPADCARLVRMRNDVDAVRAILSEFFDSTPEGWRSSRCDAEISAMQKRQQSAKDNADRRWRNAKAMQPQCDGSAEAMPSQCEPNATNTNTNTNTSITPPLSPSGAYELPDWVPFDAWADYVEMRKRIRKPMTAAAMKLAVNTLAKLQRDGHAPREVLNQSVMHAWQGLFAIRAAQNSGETPYQRQMRQRVSEATGGLLSGMDSQEVIDVTPTATRILG